MAIHIEQADLDAIALGYSAFGSGGGGSPRTVQLAVRQQTEWPRRISRVSELPDNTACCAPAFVGSTLLFSERLPSLDAFTPVLEAAERWMGEPISAVCTAEGGGMNGLVPLLFKSTYQVVDADLSGRAVPSIDQLSLFIDQVPGAFVVCDTGPHGITVVDSTRARDIEAVVRSAVVSAGGVSSFLVAGFRIADLKEHAILGHAERSLQLGRELTRLQPKAFRQLPSHVTELGIACCGVGKVSDIVELPSDPQVRTITLNGERGETFRVVARTEFLAVMIDGVVRVSSPECIVLCDALTGEFLEVPQVRLHHDVLVLRLEVDRWWYSRRHRTLAVAPSAYDLEGLGSSEGSA